MSSTEHPTYGPTGAATVDVLASAPLDETPARRAPWALVGGVAALVLALVGGVTYAVGSLGGGGAQPADALPSGAFALVTVDLDPPVGQKLDGFRFLRKFPALRDRVPLDGDLREVLFDALASKAGWTVDYDRDVAPWLGSRVGLAAYPAGAQPGLPTTVVALQVTDRDKAEKGLAALRTQALGTATGPGPGWAFSGDYALLTQDAATARALADRAGSGHLADDPAYAQDTAALGDGVARAWVDLGAAGEAAGATALGLAAGPGRLGGAAGAGGRTTLVARFDGPDVFEVVGRASGTGTAGWAGHHVQGMAELPASSVAAVGLADGGTLVPKAFAAMRAAFGQPEAFDAAVQGAQAEVGLRLPDDLATLLGSNLVAALDAGSGGELQVGARVTTDVPAAQQVLDRLQAAARARGGDLPVVRRVGPGGSDLVIASTDRQARRLAGSGTLGDVTGFRRALPDLDTADAALWLDPARLSGAVLGGPGGADPGLAPLQGVGVTVGSSAGDATYRLRLVAR